MTFWNKFLLFKKFDWILFFSVFLLISSGLAAIYSVNLGSKGDFLNFKKQLIFAVIGIILLFSFSLINYHTYKSYVIVLYVLGIILLVSVLLWGSVIRGTKGWFRLGIINFQPVEIVKMIAVIFLAYYFSIYGRYINKIKHIIWSGLGIFVPFSLTFLQPDFGSAMLLFILWFLFLIAIGLNKRYIILLTIIFSFIGVLMWNYVLKGYQKDRLAIFINPNIDPLGKGYNLMQSLIATGSGGLWGRGLGFGSQSQLKFLPESQTDFVFAVIAEELGLVGVFLVLLFYTVILYRIYRIIRVSRDDFGILLVLGISILIFVQVIVNAGMNLGLMPITGISLPFVSYGGSSLLIHMIIIGIVENVAMVSKN